MAKLKRLKAVTKLTTGQRIGISSWFALFVDKSLTRAELQAKRHGVDLSILEQRTLPTPFHGVPDRDLDADE